MYVLSSVLLTPRMILLCPSNISSFHHNENKKEKERKEKESLQDRDVCVSQWTGKGRKEDN